MTPVLSLISLMGMSDEQFKVYNALIYFVDELKNILANNKEIN